MCIYYCNGMVTWLLCHLQHVNVLLGEYTDLDLCSRSLWLSLFAKAYCGNVLVISLLCVGVFIFTLHIKSASCTHVSALLHALVAMALPVTAFLSPGVIGDGDDLPITSHACQWKPPRKR